MKKLLILISVLTIQTFAGNPKDLASFRKTGICCGCDLSGYDLKETIKSLNRRKKRIDLFCANLKDTNLRGVDLQKANMQFTQLDCAFLENTNLSTTNLQGASFFRTNFSGTQLDKTDLRNARFKECDFFDSNWNTALLGFAEMYACKKKNALFKPKTEFVPYFKGKIIYDPALKLSLSQFKIKIALKMFVESVKKVDENPVFFIQDLSTWKKEAAKK